MVKNWIIENFDKIQHFTLMAVLTALFGIIFGIGVALLATPIISVIKEIYDKEAKKEEIEQGDLRADFAGIGVGMLLLIFRLC